MNSKWLSALAEGRAIGTVAIAEGAGSIEAVDIATVASKNGAGWRLDGAKMFVPYANVADFVVVVAKSDAGEIGLFVVDTKSPGVTIRALKNLDLTRRVSSVELKGAPAEELKGGADLFAKLIDVGAVAIAADSLGGTERALEMAVEYSKVREQFGKPIGSFQALKHAAAEIVADLEPSRALLWYAAHGEGENSSREASMAKARLCDIYSRGTDRAVLMHGGIGFTWEHDMHLWFKRARFNESYFGSPGYHRERAAVLGDY
jgi:alkylation response protein AidB-like acyl-CoA dehydrogenase